MSTQELISALSILADNENVQVTFQESAKGAAICAISALVGGLLMGPRGLAVGGSIGAIAAYGLTEGKFKSLGEIIMNELSESEREALKDHVVNAITNVRPIDAVKVVGLILSNEDIGNVALNAVKSFATERMGLTIID
ncbi:protein C19orf12 homolog [Drosophila serrata]|uniref:protein C19orf12 homolog n=1 Tax=Drosophila serrata TaxID=7274 RepID=UPI000A1D2F2D|nr:protein C19orf12 homolog [Drosophila serrata]